MKKWILFGLPLVLISSITVGDTVVEGSMECSVTDNSVTIIDGGKTKKYNGFVDQFSVNDKLSVKYRWYPDVEGFRFKLNDENLKNKDRGLFNFHTLFGSESLRTPMSKENTQFITESESVDLSDSKIIYQDSQLDFVLYRHYQSDWVGLGSVKEVGGLFTSGPYIQVFSVQCRSTQDNYHKILGLIQNSETMLKLQETLERSIQELEDKVKNIKE